MGRLQSLLHRLRAWVSPARPLRLRRPCEPLESRQLLSVTLDSVQLVGSVHNVTGVVLTFSGALDPTTAASVTSYAFGKHDPQAASDSGFSVGDLFPFMASRHSAIARPARVKNGKIQFASAVYDDTAHTVTLIPYAPFRAPAFFKFLRVRGSGAHLLRDADGLPFNGGIDLGENWRMRTGKVIRYVDAAHDHITLKLTGPGHLFVFQRRANNADPLIFIDGATAATAVNGSVLFSQQAIGPVNVAELQGAGGITTNLLTNSDFVVQTNLP